MNKYKKAIIEEINKLAKLDNAIFLGQQVGVTTFYDLITNVDKNKRIELPVCEELQLGMSIGLALEGFLPISIYQRMDFLPRAMDQLVNHLDILKELSDGLFNPKILIITTVGTKESGLQHNKDLSKWLKVGLKNIKVFNPKTAWQVKRAFEKAKKYNGSSIIVFYQDLMK